jgi:integrase
MAVFQFIEGFYNPSRRHSAPGYLSRTALADWIRLSGLASDDFLFPSRVHASPHLSTRRYARIVDSWIEEIGLDPAAYGTHSIRRTKPSLIYRRTKNLRAVQLLLGHTKLDSTVRIFASRWRTPWSLRSKQRCNFAPAEPD